jgi:glycosyltransferase involved in cell wall biosynthesis
MSGIRVDVVVPALDEAETIGSVVRGVSQPCVRDVVVVDNGSTDGTAEAAQAAGARVVHEPRRGYGSACLAGLRALSSDGDIIVFLDGDGSDDVRALRRLIAPIVAGSADFVVGTRVAEPGALTGTQRLGNALAATWLRVRFGLHATDLGPFRAISRAALAQLDMRDRGYGWTIEMQLKAARRGLRYTEIPVRYRPRVAGRSKVSGSVKGMIGASCKIIVLLGYYGLLERPR